MRISSFAAGVISVVLVAVGLYAAFISVNPFASPYELSARFADAQNLKPGAPVRITGIDVGEVTGVEPAGSGTALVNMEIEDRGLPLHRDAQLEVRPRIFLEGNYVVAIRPGTPAAGTLPSGSTIPYDQTSNSVKLGEVLKVLDKDTRRSLQTLLDELGRALGRGGAKGINDSIRYWRRAYRTTALASQALLGEEPGDLTRVLRGQQGTAEALVRDPQALKDLVTNLDATTAAFAREDAALQASVPALRDVLRAGSPALASLNASFPEVRAFAVDARPAVRSSGPTIDAARPFVAQLRRLVSEDELRGTARELRRAIPALARLNRDLIPALEEVRLLASCTTTVLVPGLAKPIPDPDFPDNSGQPAYRQAARSFVGLAGESRIGDANGQLFRVLVGGGPTTLVQTRPGAAEPFFTQALFPSLGARPAPPRERPPFRPDVPCETQEPPNLEAPRAPGDASTQPEPSRSLLADMLPNLRRQERRLERDIRPDAREERGR